MADSDTRLRSTGGVEWYADGLRFECTRCNQCCTGEPGFVWVDRNRVVSIADFLAVTVREFLTRYCRRVWWRVSLKEMDNGDCVFLTEQGCSIYPVRPEQCRSFPFWPDSLASPTRWEAVRARCPGVGRGRLYAVREIHSIRDGERAV
jgi:Fe-S-cluster containining protein